VLCDLDVDAPDLHLILRPQPSGKTPFFSGSEARIRADSCQDCGICADMCRFDAIRSDGPLPAVDPIRCEGCGVCVRFCPADAIDFVLKKCGEWTVSKTRFGPLVHAQLYPGEENSGKLIALLREKARDLAESSGKRVLLSDGPPGIGCPVISAVSGTNLAIVVTEPTPSGIHDLLRVVELCEHFQVPAAVIINKADLNSQISEEIRLLCRNKNLPVLIELPHDAAFVEALVNGMAITELGASETTRKIRLAWQKILEKAAAKIAA
jgi:MinD superfamily P-loop ATPase